MKRFIIAIEYDSTENGFRMHNSGYTFVDVNDFELVEHAISVCMKYIKKHFAAGFMLTFGMSDSVYPTEDNTVYYGRLSEEYNPNGTPCLYCVRWNDKHSVDTSNIELNKKSVKDFILEMIRRYKKEITAEMEV